MNNSNYTLRFPRTSREAYGYWIRLEPDHHWAEPYIWTWAMLAFGFLIGYAVFGG